MFVPTVITVFFRLINPKLSTDLFFTTLNEIDPELCQHIKAQPKCNKPWFLHFCKQAFKFVVVGSFIFILSHAPLFGFLVLPAVQFYFLVKTMKWPIALFVSVLSIWSPLTNVGIKSWFAVHSLFFELAEPYLCTLESKKRREFIAQNRTRITVFMGPLLALLSIPVIGTIAWPTTQATTAALIASIATP
ncbi:hypothetical protein Pelo_13690 [Pelomyxa schiedti]|nr:hypothetical protein Pelo_13690 [Pelomyxa schiedti]